MRTAQVVGNVISGKDVYVGIDVHKESWHVTIRSDREERFNGRIPGQYQSLKRILERYREDQGSLRSRALRLLAP